MVKNPQKHDDMVTLPDVNLFASRKEWEEACWRKLLQSKKWLHRIITPYERHNIIMRAAAAHRLNKGASYNDIGKELWLSPQTISTIKKGMNGGYQSYAERGKTERKKRVYSSMSHSSRQHRKIGIPRRTKYGTVYL